MTQDDFQKREQSLFDSPERYAEARTLIVTLHTMYDSLRTRCDDLDRDIQQLTDLIESEMTRTLNTNQGLAEKITLLSERIMDLSQRVAVNDERHDGQIAHIDNIQQERHKFIDRHFEYQLVELGQSLERLQESFFDFKHSINASLTRIKEDQSELQDRADLRSTALSIFSDLPRPLRSIIVPVAAVTFFFAIVSVSLLSVVWLIRLFQGG